MSKELTPLEAVKKIRVVLSQSEQLFNDIFATNKDPIKPTLKNIKDAIKKTSIIETALEDYDSLLEKYDFKDIKELDDFLNKHRFIHQEQIDNEKKLKAFEIIKKKKVDVEKFIYACMCSEEQIKEYHGYGSKYEFAATYVGYGKKFLTQKEYDLLKEVLL